MKNQEQQNEALIGGSELNAGLERSFSRRMLPTVNPILMAFVSGLNVAFGFAAALDGRDFALHVGMGIGFGFMSAVNQWTLVRSNAEVSRAHDQA